MNSPHTTVDRSPAAPVRRLVHRAMMASMVLAISLHAEEGAAGHYKPGGIATRGDGAPTLPDASTLSFQFDFYDGSLENGPAVPASGTLWADLSRRTYTVSALGYTTFRERVLGSTFSMGFQVPFIWLEAS